MTNNIYQKMHAIMTDVSYVQKEDKKVNNQYKFVSHDAVSAKIRPSLLKHGVLAIPSYFDVSVDGNRTNCSMSITFVNIDKPEEKIDIPCAGFGQGIDPQDKGAGKAMSYAYKYAMLKIFALETGDDPEKDNIDHSAAKEEAAKKELDEKRVKAEAWVNGYMLDLGNLASPDDLIELQKKNTAMLNRIREGYPNLHNKITVKTNEVREVTWSGKQ